MFSVKTSQESLNDAFTIDIVLEKTMYLGIGYKGIFIISQKKRNVVKTILFSQLDQIKVFTNAVMIYEKGKQVSIRFNTSQSYQIFELCQDYRAIIDEIKDYKESNK